MDMGLSVLRHVFTGSFRSDVCPPSGPYFLSRFVGNNDDIHFYLYLVRFGSRHHSFDDSLSEAKKRTTGDNCNRQPDGRDEYAAAAGDIQSSGLRRRLRRGDGDRLLCRWLLRHASHEAEACTFISERGCTGFVAVSDFVADSVPPRRNSPGNLDNA